MTIYNTGYKTAYANLDNGSAATLFSSYDQQTVNTHFSLMQQNGCDTAALQRFDPNGGEGPTRNAMTAKVKHRRAGLRPQVLHHVRRHRLDEHADRDAGRLDRHDVAYTVVARVRAPERQAGGGHLGLRLQRPNHPWAAAACLEVIKWFQSQGCYVMGGVPTYWRTGVSDSRAGYLSVYHAFNMISPWMVGRIGTAADSDNFYTNVNVGDQAYCNANGIDYQPCVLPGDLSADQRAHGDFMWGQFYNMVRVGAQGIYISMFDEFGEGNQIANTAPTQATVPTNSGLLSLDEDGTACSADYYLRLTNDGGRMLKGQIALTATRPTQPVR